MMYHGHLKAPWQSDPDLYFGKHRRVPVPPPIGGYRFQDPAMVSRAIPVDGAVTEPGPSWAISPQARFWLEPEPVSIRELIRRKIKKAVSWGKQLHGGRRKRYEPWSLYHRKGVKHNDSA